MKTFKITLLLAGLFMFSTAAFSQFNIGPMLTYGDATDLGFGVKAEFAVTDQISVSPSFALLNSTSIDFLGINLKSSISEFNADGHYAFSDVFYGLAGINLAFVSVNAAGVKESDSMIGINLGVGAKFDISDSIKGFTQAKYGIGGIEQLGIHAGVYFSLGGN